MSFTQPCFIRKNTPELRKKLERLGYKKDFLFEGDLPYIHVGIWNYSDSEYCYGEANYDAPILFHTHAQRINCGTNEELFLALAALRDDNDYMQWFISDKNEWIKCEREYFYQEPITKTWRTWHKASVKEIAEHFKKYKT